MAASSSPRATLSTAAQRIRELGNVKPFSCRGSSATTRLTASAKAESSFSSSSSSFSSSSRGRFLRPAEGIFSSAKGRTWTRSPVGRGGPSEMTGSKRTSWGFRRWLSLPLKNLVASSAKAQRWCLAMAPTSAAKISVEAGPLSSSGTNTVAGTLQTSSSVGSASSTKPRTRISLLSRESSRSPDLFNEASLTYARPSGPILANFRISAADRKEPSLTSSFRVTFVTSWPELLWINFVWGLEGCDGFK
mmetsp:Transcript_5170/g.16267  ORF Transcript_5170/g.16267 Transcript_5170/m.16267 type:complete len:248 (-) Transcript_5170:299-1042(-)